MDNILNKRQMTKEQLENRVKELTVLIEESSNGVKNLVDEQHKLIKDLEDINKPKLSNAQMDEIQHIVESACEVFELDANDCDLELEIDYDNRIQVNNFDWSRCQEDLTQHIMDRLEDFFAVAEDKE